MITIATRGQSREIVNQDVIDVAREALTQSIPPEREIIDLIPTEFTVDGFSGIKDPRGMVGVRLEMKATLYTGPKTIIHNTKKAVQQAGYDIKDFVITPIATDFNLLNDGEQDFGTVVIDLGGGQTTTSIIHDHQLKYTYVDPEGGKYITKDISTVMNTSLKNAEQLKLNHGYAMASLADEDVQVDVDVVGQNDPVQYSEQYLSEIIEARVRQIFDRIQDKLKAIHAPELPGGVVLIGGVAALPGVKELAEQYFTGNIKVNVPEQMGIRHPRYAVSLALGMYENQLSDIDRLIKQTVQRIDTIKSPHEEKGQTVNQPRQQWTEKSDKLQRSQREAQQQPVTEEPAPKKKKQNGLSNRFKNIFNNLFD